ncbi:MAG TPA: serine/threonine protein kinase [Vicinamibacteria bacterium]|nr:serine/threonine protein kinase [Vicinamibacteria bacterium]
MRPTSNRPASLARKVARLGRLLRTGLLGRFVLVLGAVGLIPLVIIPWLVNQTRDSVVDQILVTHSVTARTTAGRVDAWIRSLRISAQTISSNPYLLTAKREQVAEMIAGLVQADPAIKGALVVNAAGAEVGSATRAGFSGIAGPALAAATAEPVAVVPGDRLWIRIATQLDEARGELRILVDGSALSELLMTEEIGRDAIIGLFDADARLIASSNVSGDAARFPKALLQAGKARATSGAARYDDRDPVIAGAHSRVQTAPWFVASIQPATTAERVAAKMRRTGLLSVLVAVLLTGLFSSLGYVAIIRPIDEIARSQWKVARRRDKSAPSGNEISQLREAFATIRRQTLDREAIGKLFLSRYLVLDILGTGGMGSVFRGWDPKLERPVAIKTVHMGGSSRASVDIDEQRHVLMREAVTVAKFNHPNIVAIYDVEDAGEAAFLAMEFVDGMSLENYLARVGTLRIEMAVPLIIQISRGLEAAHNAGVIHCDIKPANILLGRDGGIKVTDFGIARSAIRATGNISGTFGTPGYLPPEALDSATFTPMADLFGVGAVFYELLTGEPPHAGRTPQETLVRTATATAVSVRERNKSVPPAIDEIILGLLEKNPQQRRPASARELANALEAIADKHGWKWVAPPLLAEESAISESERETAAIPGSGKLG